MMLRRLKFAALMFLASGPLHAGSQPPPSAHAIQCERVAMGALYRVEGHADRVIWMARADMVGDEPKDGIHIRDDGETPDQKRNWETLLLRGWHDQDDYMAAHGGTPFDARAQYVQCLKSEES